MTRNMIEHAHSGGFGDGAWMNMLLYRFIEYYFDALDSYTSHPGAAPVVWQHSFDGAGDPDLHVLQNLMLGVNAHISYDLVFALTDVMQLDWASADEACRQCRYADYGIVNRVICQTLDAVQDGVVERYSPAMDWVDRGFGRFDEWATERMIARWREDSWRSALALFAAPAADQPALRAEVEARAVRRADAIRGEKGLLGIFSLL
jgi:hypothetical protein